MLCTAAVPNDVPFSDGAMPRFTTHGPPLEPPVWSEPMIVLFESVVK